MRRGLGRKREREKSGWGAGGVKDEWQELDDKGPDVKQGSSARVRDLAKDEGQGGRH